MSLKGLILAGGEGTRLRPLTHSTPKSLIPVANKPIVSYVIEQMIKIDIREIAIVYKDPKVKEFVQNMPWSAEITFIEQPEPLGLAHAVLCAREFLAEDDFIMYLGDNMIGDGLGMLAYNMFGGSVLMCTEVENPKAFGVMTFDKYGHVESVEEKPEYPKTNWAMVGIYRFTKTIHKAIDNIEPSARGELEITDAINWMLKNTNEHIVAEDVRTWWLDLGKKDSLLEANRRILELGSIDVGNSKIESSLIDKPVAIDSCTILNSRIGPNVTLGNGVKVINSCIKNSIVLPEAEIVNVHLEDSIIGERASVKLSQGTQKMSLNLGDNSELTILDKEGQ